MTVESVATTQDPEIWTKTIENVTCGLFNCRTEVVTAIIIGVETGGVPKLASHLNILILVLMVAMDAAGLYINFFGLAVILRSNLPKTTSDMLVVNIAISDTLSAVLIYPLCILSVARQNWALGHSTCVWYAFGFPFLGVVSINTMASIAAERYLTVAKRSESWRVARMQGLRWVAAVWISAFLVAVPNIVLLSDSSANISHLRNSICNLEMDHTDVNPVDVLYPIYFFIVCLVVPVSVTTYCYCKLYFMVRHVARRVRSSRMSVIAMTVTAADGSVAPPAGLNASASPQEEVKTERIIAKRMIFMVLVTFFSWLPYSLTEVAVIGFHYQIPLALRILPSVFAKGCIIYNPLIYIAFSKKFNKAFKDYLRCRWGKKSRVQAFRPPAPAPRAGAGRDVRNERSSFMRQQTFPLLNQANMIHETHDHEHGKYLDPGGNTTSGYGTASLTPTAYLSRTPMPSNSALSTQVTYLDPTSNFTCSSIVSKSPAKVKISLPETQMRTAMLLRKDTEETFRFIHDARPQPRRKNGVSTLHVPNMNALVVPSSHRQIKIEVKPMLPDVPDRNTDSVDTDDHLGSKGQDA